VRRDALEGTLWERLTNLPSSLSEETP
jgi:hypothetical protein